MSFALYVFIQLAIIFLLNNIFIKNNYLVNETGDSHQKFTSKSKIPLTGGIFLYLCIIFFINDNILSFLLFSLLILILGISSDLKLIKSAIKRLIFQISIVMFFIIFNEIKILDTRIIFLDNLLINPFLNYFFVCFCILIIINGSNFFDGLNTLSIGYYLLISIIIFYLNSQNLIRIENISMNYVLFVIVSLYFLNLFNKVFLGDSGSYLLGFMFSIFLINLYEVNKHISPFFIILLLWYPGYETLFSIIRKKILKKSPIKPDSNHLHQLIFFLIKKNFIKNTYFANIFTANFINIYNLIIFFISSNYISNSKIQLILIFLNLILYTISYFRLIIYRYKKI